MNSFELNFGLTSVILGLALTHLANAVRKLLLRGNKVAWAPEPVMVAIILLILIVSLWMEQFSRNTRAVTEDVALLNVLRMLTIYFAAGFCLPEPEPNEAKIDLYRYYNRTRGFTFGSLIAGLIAYFIYNTVVTPAGWREDLITKLLPIVVWVALILVRWRWLSVLLLLIPLFGASSDILQASLAKLGK